MSFMACNRDIYKLQPIKETSQPTKVITKTEQSFENGIDFIASGSYPVSWILEMDFENQFSFKTATDSLSLLSVPALITPNEKIYQLKDRAGDIDISISRNFCESDQRQQKVSIKYKNVIYTSCGAYLYDAKLAGIWDIVALGNNALSTTDYKDGFPTIIFEAENKKFKGLSPCLLFSTDIEIEGRHIKVKEAAATSTSKCNNTKMLTHFKEKVLGKWMSYKISGDLLFLYLSDDSNLTLQRHKK